MAETTGVQLDEEACSAIAESVISKLRHVTLVKFDFEACAAIPKSTILREWIHDFCFSWQCSLAAMAIALDFGSQISPKPRKCWIHLIP